MAVFAVACGFTANNDLEQKRPKKEKKQTGQSYILFGDLHYDKLEDHDMEWMAREKPGDVRQVTQSYVPNTDANWKDLMGVARSRVKTYSPPVKAVVQLGDLSEGLAGSETLAVQMANSAINAVKDSKMGVPWLITKGNHDITGPGAKEAFVEVYTPYIREQAGDPNIRNASYTYRNGDVLFVFLDLWDKETDMVKFLEESLNNSDAKYKFVTMHEPAIPVTERCWHTLRKEKEAAKRAKFLEVLAKNKAIVLTAHLHRYSVVKRETEHGPIVQVMVASVIGKKRRSEPTYTKTMADYGPGLVDWKPDYSPKNADERRKMLTEEAKYVTYYKMCDLAGYGMLSIDEKKGEVVLEYYAGFEDQPYDTVNLTQLYKESK